MNFAGIQKLTLLDYPGRCAATVFTPGCDLRCPFCHNASLVEASVETECAPGCEPDEILDFLRSRKGRLTGLAITGGEPLMQNGVEDFLAEVKSIGYAVKLDTNGTYPEKLKHIVNTGLADYVAMDIKNCDESWANTTGLSDAQAAPLLARVHQSMDFLRTCGIDFEFRTTVVGGLHSPADMESLGKMLSAPAAGSIAPGPGSKPVEKYFLQNFADSGDILAEGMTGCSKETMEEYLTIIRKYIPTAQMRGL